MQLKSLKLENFRNYEKLDIQFDQPVTAFIGQNAQGKTNILEAVAFLALGKSFRARKALDTLLWDAPHGRIKAEFDEEESLEIFLQAKPEQKKFKHNELLVKPSEFLGHLRVVLFTPDHMQLISGSPRLRRQYLDRLLIQMHRPYVESLSKLQRVLKHRNALLKRQCEDWELDMWDAQLVTEAQTIWKHRRDFLNFLGEHIAELYQAISGTEEELKLTLHTHEENYEERLIAHRDQDRRTGTTSVGPHRDDFELHLDGHPLAEIGSRGEQRSSVLALKVAQIHYIEAETGQKPLLLLDDVFSELDAARQKQLGVLLKNHQSLITTTAMEHVEGISDMKVFKVEAGTLA